MISIKNWEKKCLDNLFSFHGGLGISREQLGDKGIPYLHYGDMHKGTFSSVSYNDYTALPKYNIKINGDEDFLMKDGDVVFLDASEDLTGTSRCVVIDNPDNKPFIAGLHTFIARPLDNSLCKWYKKYFTQTQDVQKQFERLSVGFKVYGVNRNSIKNIVVSFPSNIKEQQRIAKILAKWDEAIGLQERLIEKLEIQKKGLMKKLLMPKKDWKENRIKNIFTITRGQVLSTDNCNNSYKYPVYSSQTQNDGLMGYYKDYLYENAITWTTDGANAGEVKYRNGKFYCTNVCGVLLNTEGYANECFAYLLNSVAKKYVSFVGNPKLMNNVMGEIKISYPPIITQQKISNIYSKLLENIKLHSQKLELFKKQRKALMQLLLTGTVRV